MQLNCFIVVLLRNREKLWRHKKSQKNWSLKDIWPSYDKTCVCSDNTGQNICNKVEKLSKVGHDKKSLISTFWMCLHPWLIFFQYFLISSVLVIWQLMSRHQVSFYLWQIEPVLKHCKVPKHYDQDCRYQISAHTNSFDI